MLPMNVRATLLLLSILVILLPIGVGAVAWWGLDRMGREIAHLAEEYGEARTLSDAEARAMVATAAIRRSDTREAWEESRREFVAVESLLLSYLEDQAVSVASDTHQSGEFRLARAALADVRTLLESTGEQLSASARLDLALMVESRVRALRGLADLSVDEAGPHAQAITRSTLEAVVGTSLVAAAICAIVAVRTNRAVLRDLRALHRAIAARVDSSRPLPRAGVDLVVSQIDEFSERMYRQIQEKNREILRRDRVAGIGLIAADVAHELRNPLNAMLGLTELSLRAADAGPVDGAAREELRESLTVVRREALRCREIVDRLMNMVRARSRPARIDATALLAESVQIARAARPDKAACFHLLRPGQSVPVVVPGPELKQVILTLLINAADAVTADGRIEVDVTASETEAWFRVRDDGLGFDRAHRPDRAVPFETSRGEEGGLGLGLSIAQSIADDIGAEIRCESEGPGRGSLFVVAVPLREESV